MLVAAGTGTAWIAFPYRTEEPLVIPLERVTEAELSTNVASPYGADLTSLRAAFQPQPHRSFCGPATLATVLRADGRASATEWALFDSVADGVRTFYGGMSLAELARLAQANGLHSELVRGDEFTVESFRERLKQNLAHAGDYVIINYDRRALDQAGAGHISAVGGYDPSRDAFLILDQAAYRYPWTWVPTRRLYEATRTLDGSAYRGVLFVQGEHRSRTAR
ncbi:MAG: phytochelatin synthase family protein [Pseudomonadota bacterium]|nr:phytochelatin synthase family protein [Pseudomonadota bacterium]